MKTQLIVYNADLRRAIQDVQTVGARVTGMHRLATNQWVLELDIEHQNPGQLELFEPEPGDDRPAA